MSTPSALLNLPGAVAGEGRDDTIAAHYGSFNIEQRHLVAGDGFVDLSNRSVFTIKGPDRLAFLHAMTTQFFERLSAGVPIEALVLSPQGHIEHAFAGADDGETFLGHCEPGAAAALVDFLNKMKFMMRVEIEESDQAVCWRPVDGGRFDVVDREELEAYATAAGPACGRWAYDALRIAAGTPRIGVDTDLRTIPNEAGLIGSAVHLDKGCYRGQETVARVHTLGRPPRRLTLLHFDGSAERLPSEGDQITQDATRVGTMGSSARHFEAGPLGLALVKRKVAVDASLEVGDMVAGQEVVVDPEVGLHVRPRL